MELKAKCNTCIHRNICFRRPTFEGLFEEEGVMAPLRAANEMTDWIEIDVSCKDYNFDYCIGSIEAVPLKDKKGILGLKRGNKND